MSKPLPPSLNIEWSPTAIRAIDTVTGKTAQGRSWRDLAPILNDHKQAVVGVSRNSVFLKTLRLPKASASELRQIVALQSGQIFALPFDELSYDFVQTSDTTPEGTLTLIAAMRTSDLRELRLEMKQAGLSPTRVLPVALGSPAVAASAGGPKDALVLERVPEGLALDVVQDGTLRVSRVAQETGEASAEAQRTLAAAGLPNAPLVGAGEPVLPDALPGFGNALSHLQEAPAFHFELAEDLLIARKQRMMAQMRLAGLWMLAAVLAVVGVGWDRASALSQAQAEQATWARQIAKLHRQQDDALDSASPIIAAQQTLDRAFHPAQPLSDIEAVIADSLPRGAWLTGITIERGKPLEIRGTAKSAADVASLVSALGASPRLRDIHLIYANSGTIGKAPIVEFTIHATAVGNLPMPAPTKGGFSRQTSSQEAGTQT